MMKHNHVSCTTKTDSFGVTRPAIEQVGTIAPLSPIPIVGIILSLLAAVLTAVPIASAQNAPAAGDAAPASAARPAGRPEAPAARGAAPAPAARPAGGGPNPPRQAAADDPE